MKSQTILVLILFTTFLFPGLSLGGTINQMTLVSDGGYQVEVNATLCDGNYTSLTSSVGDNFFIQIFSLGCEKEKNVLLTFNVPKCQEFNRIQTNLYDGLVVTTPSDIMSMNVNIDINKDECLELCDEKLADCNSTCIAKCEGAESDCYDECFQECQTLWSDCIADYQQVHFLLRCEPETLNIKSHGRWITCFLTPSDGNTTDLIDTDSVILDVMGQSIAPDFLNSDENLLLLKFNRQAVIAAIMADGNITFPTQVKLNVSGNLDEGLFGSSDTITVINPGQKNKKGTKQVIHTTTNKGHYGKPDFVYPKDKDSKHKKKHGKKKGHFN